MRPHILPRRRGRLAVAVAALVVVLAGCAGGNGGSSPAADEGPPVQGGTLRLAATGGNASNLDPQTNEGSAVDGIRWGALFDKLMVMDAKGNPVPSLAESMTPNATGDQWTVRLRPDAKLHDGRLYDADDLIASVRRILNPETAAKGASTLSFVDPDGLQKVDQFTVLFALKAPYGLFKQAWTTNYVRMVPKDFDPARPVGTGPFTLVSYTPGQQSTMARFDGYWGEKAHVDKVVVTDVAEASAQVNALRGGQVDIIDQLPLAEVPAIKAGDTIRILQNPTWQYFPIVMNVEKKPFDDPRVREALRLVANRQQMVDIALNRFGVAANDYASRTTACAQPDLPPRAQDIERAKQLLAEAGVPDLKLELVTTNGAAGMAEAAPVFAEQAKAAGIDITVRKLDGNDYLARYGEWDFAVDWIIDDYPGSVRRSLLPGAAYNNSHWNDPEFTALAARAFAEPDDAARCDLFARMKTIEYQRGAAIVWGFSDSIHGYSSRVHGLQENIAGDELRSLNKVWLS